MKLIHYLFLAAALAVPVVGCGSDKDSDNGSNNNNNDVPATAETDVSAAAGGELTVGEASLAIPAGALAADTKITVESKEPSSSLPDQASLKGLVYEFGPDGTTFSKPVSLTLPLPATPGDGEEAVVSWLDTKTNAWVDLKTTVSGGEVKADVEHFTMFIVRFRGVTAIDCSFAACGGEVVGEWEIQGACIESDDNPFQDACPTATIDIGLDVAGSVKFTADGTYTTVFTGTNAINVGFPAECITNNFGTSITSCDQLGETFDDDDSPEKTATCTGDVTSSCTCTISETLDPEPETGTYVKDGNFITMQESTDTTGKDAQQNEFCVDENNDTLKIALKEDGKTSGIISAVKKK